MLSLRSSSLQADERFSRFSRRHWCTRPFPASTSAQKFVTSSRQASARITSLRKSFTSILTKYRTSALQASSVICRSRRMQHTHTHTRKHPGSPSTTATFPRRKTMQRRPSYGTERSSIPVEPHGHNRDHGSQPLFPKKDNASETLCIPRTP